MLLRRAAAVAGAALRCSQQQQQQLPHHQRCMATAALSWYHPQQQQPTQQQSRFRLAARPATVAAGSSVTASVLSVAKPTFQAPAGTRSYMGQSFPVRKLQLFQRQGRGKRCVWACNVCRIVCAAVVVVVDTPSLFPFYPFYPTATVGRLDELD